MSLTLEDIKSLVNKGGCELIARKPDILANYMDFREKILKQWRSMDDYIKFKYLIKKYQIDKEGKYYTENSEKIIYALEKNKFPYNIEEKYKHMVLWATAPLSAEEIEKILTENYGENRDNRYWFEQPISLKSVKGVWHVHIFVLK